MRKASRNLFSAFIVLTVAIFVLAVPAHVHAASASGSGTDNSKASTTQKDETATTSAKPATTKTAKAKSGTPDAASAPAPAVPKASAVKTDDIKIESPAVSETKSDSVQTETKTTAAPPAPAPQPGPARAKAIEATDVSTSALSKGSIDIYLSLTNTGKRDDALTGAETPLSDNLTFITETGGKEKEAPLKVELPAGKATSLAAGDKFLRVSGITKTLKEGDRFELFLHFRSAPNVTVDVTVHKKSSSVLGW